MLSCLVRLLPVFLQITSISVVLFLQSLTKQVLGFLGFGAHFAKAALQLAAFCLECPRSILP